MNVPYVFTLDEMMSFFLHADVAPSAAEIQEASVRLGRNFYPALLSDLWAEGLLAESAVAAAVVPSAWSAVEFPHAALDDDLWAILFGLAGYTIDGVPGPKPAGLLHLWRGALSSHRNGWAWTDDEELAQWFADRTHNNGQGHLWVADVAPGRLLARIGERRPGESEYVVDARGLEVHADSLRTRRTS